MIKQLIENHKPKILFLKGEKLYFKDEQVAEVIETVYENYTYDRLKRSLRVMNSGSLDPNLTIDLMLLEKRK